MSDIFTFVSCVLSTILCVWDSFVGSCGNHLCDDLLKGLIHINLIITEITFENSEQLLTPKKR